jgi:hypothetical protein
MLLGSGGLEKQGETAGAPPGGPSSGVSPEKLWVNPDCGLKTRAWPETLLALGNMVQAARVLRQKYSDTQNIMTR